MNRWAIVVERFLEGGFGIVTALGAGYAWHTWKIDGSVGIFIALFGLLMLMHAFSYPRKPSE